MNCFICVLLILYCISQVQPWRPFIIRFTAVRCVRKSEKTAFLNCSLIKLSKWRVGLNMDVKFTSELTEPKLNIVFTGSRLNQPDFELMNVTDVDGCQFLEQKGFNILQIISRQFLKYSDMPRSCPVPKGTEIHVKNLIMEADSFPPYMPDTNFSVFSLMWEKNTPIMEFYIQGSVESKNKFKWT